MHPNAPFKSINYMSGLLHHPSLYAYIHKHHHRSVYPFRGNVDARNEHPIEQLRLGEKPSSLQDKLLVVVQLNGYTVCVHN